MADELRIHERPELERPILIAAFRGWNDGGQGASLAAGYLARLWDADQIADVDPEEFFDFQATRPHVKPNLRWQAFTKLVVDFVAQLGVELVVTLGSLLADVPHTRPCPVTGSATDPELVERLGLQASRYEGPTGIVGVLHDACRQQNLPSVSLWAAVPHYVSLTPSPRAALALCERLGSLLNAEIDVEELKEAADGYVEQVSRAVETDADTQAYVEDLESRADELDESDLPSGEALAAELTRFLREQDRENGPPDAATEQ